MREDGPFVCICSQFNRKAVMLGVARWQGQDRQASPSRPDVGDPAAAGIKFPI
jgi:hypothetical protein